MKAKLSVSCVLFISVYHKAKIMPGKYIVRCLIILAR